MATTRSNRNATTKKQLENETLEVIEDAKQVSSDFVEYLTDYARQKPGTAALWCLGVGFVLGWKLKPW